MNLFDWADHHWFVAGWCAVISTGAVASLFWAASKRIQGCSCVTCDCADARTETVEACADLLDGMCTLETTPQSLANHLRETLNGRPASDG